MSTPSNLQKTVEQLLPQLSAEIGETQDELRKLYEQYPPKEGASDYGTKD